MAKSTEKKRQVIETKKEKIVDLLLANGWKPNVAYLESKYGHWTERIKVDAICNERGVLNPAIFKYVDENYLIDSTEKWAITVKKQVLTIHDRNRGFCKVMSIKMEDAYIEGNFLMNGLIGIKLS